MPLLFRLPCVFYIVSHNLRFVKNLFRLVACDRFGLQSAYASRPELDAVPVVTGKPSLNCTPIISHLLPVVKKNFSASRICSSSRSRSGAKRQSRDDACTCGKGLVCGFLSPGLPCLHPSARVALVVLTVGLMALFPLPGLSPVDFYHAVTCASVCGLVGTRRLDVQWGMVECSAVPLSARPLYHILPRKSSMNFAILP